MTSLPDYRHILEFLLEWLQVVNVQVDLQPTSFSKSAPSLSSRHLDVKNCGLLEAVLNRGICASEIHRSPPQACKDGQACFLQRTSLHSNMNGTAGGRVDSSLQILHPGARDTATYFKIPSTTHDCQNQQSIYGSNSVLQVLSTCSALKQWLMGVHQYDCFRWEQLLDIGWPTDHKNSRLATSIQPPFRRLRRRLVDQAPQDPHSSREP